MFTHTVELHLFMPNLRGGPQCRFPVLFIVCLALVGIFQCFFHYTYQSAILEQWEVEVP